MKKKTETITDIIRTSVRLIIARVDAYLSDEGKTGTLRKYPVLEDEVSRITDEDLEEWAEVLDGKSGKSKLSGTSERYKKALFLFEKDNVLESLLDMCVAEFLFPEFGAFVKEGFGCEICIRVAALLEGQRELSYSEIHRYEKLLKRLLIIDEKSEPLQYARVTADERLLGFLSADDGIGAGIADFTRIFRPGDELHEPFANQNIIESGVSFFENGGNVLFLTGNGGRRFIARHIARNLDRNFLFLNIADLIRKAGEEDIVCLKNILLREASMHDAGICIFGFSQDFITGGSPDRVRGKRDMDLLAGMLISPLSNEEIKLIVCVDDPRMVPAKDSISGMKTIDLPSAYDYEERRKLWKGLFELNNISMDPDSFASRYLMNPREASFAIAGYAQQEKDDKSASQDKTTGEKRFMILDHGSLHSAEEVGRIIYSDVRLEDVKLKDDVKKVLKDTVTAVLYGPKIMDEWKLKNSYPYGRGVSLLMAGPPGTGKTMSANAIAGELSLPLLQINLSNVVDKYIGETEKNLEKAFSFAEKNNVILFFDEADSLFATRSEVHDSKDRYANNEVSYLLQRMETYNGTVLLTTNIKGNIDPAFMRRIRFVTYFENPDEELRRQIWQGCLTDDVPHGEIDVDYLASQFDTFTGSVIKTVFLNACALAAADGKLEMKHLIYALKQENEKGKAVGFTLDTLGKYAYLAYERNN